MMLSDILHSVNTFLNFDDRNNMNFSNGNLLQGITFVNISNQKKERLYPELKSLQITSSPHLGSIVESLESNNSIQKKNNEVSKNISKYEEEFNRTLAEYSNAYKTFINELINNNNVSENRQYFGKTVSNSGNYVYINDYGFTHKYSTDSWNKKDSSCSGSITNIDSKIYNLLGKGPDIGVGQACKVAGQNVKNEKTGQVSWVDIKGYKHVYPTDVWVKKQDTCNISPINLSENAYNAIPTGSNMTSASSCNKLNVNEDLIKKLDLLNAKLVSIATKIINENKQINTDDNKMREKLNKQHAILQNNINSLNRDRNILYSQNTDYTTIQGSADQSGKYLNYTFYNYMIWLILGIIFVIIVVKISLEMGGDNVSETSHDSILLVLLILVVFYYLIQWISRNYY
jgi:hypothetical protein